MLEELKTVGGQFMNADEIDEFLKDRSINDKTKNPRLKKFMQFARDSRVTPPKVDPLIGIPKTLPKKKTR